MAPETVKELTDIENSRIHIHAQQLRDEQYGKFLKRLCESVNSPVTNNHAIRMYFTSYVLIPAGVTDADRAAWLGHSVRTNLEHYTFPDLSYSDNIAMKLNLKKSTGKVQVTKGDQRKIVLFGKRKTPEST